MCYLYLSRSPKRLPWPKEPKGQRSVKMGIEALDYAGSEEPHVAIEVESQWGCRASHVFGVSAKVEMVYVIGAPTV